MSIKQKLIIILLTIAVIPTVLVGMLGFINFRDALHKEQIEKLESIAELKAEKLELYFQERINDIKVAQDLYNIRNNLPTMVRFANDRTNPEYLSAKKKLDDQLKTFQRVYGYNDLMLVSPDGIIVYVTNEEHEDLDLDSPLPDPGNRAFEGGRKGVYFSDIFFARDLSDYFEMLVTAPSYGFDGKFAGVIVLELDMAPIYDFIQNTTGLGETGETLIGKKVNNNVLFLNTLRYDPGAALKRSVLMESHEAIPMQEAVQGKKGAGLSHDYRNEKIIAAWRHVPLMDWGLVAKVDTKEAFASADRLKRLIMIILGTVLALVTGIAIYVAKSITDPVKLLTKTADKISRGSLDGKISGADNEDEIGELTRSFNRMLENLRKSRDKLAKKTDELAESLTQSKDQNKVLTDTKKAMFNIMEELEEQTKQLETKKTDLERSNQELEQFAYIASHDLQEPLRMVSSYMHLLGKKYTGQLDTKADKWIHYAVDGAQRMQGMIEDILVYSRVGRKEAVFEPVDVTEVIESVRKNLKRHIKQAGASVIAENLPVVHGERGQLTQLFQNLVQNAIKFKGENAPTVEITAKKEGNQWVFAVSDNGIGIDPRFSDSIFTMFKRLHGRSDYEGTGIGLAITKKIVERHGGKIWVESEVGKGSVFYVRLLAS